MKKSIILFSTIVCVLMVTSYSNIKPTKISAHNMQIIKSVKADGDCCEQAGAICFKDGERYDDKFYSLEPCDDKPVLE